MSRYAIPHPQWEITVGWDHPLQTFFVQVRRLGGKDGSTADPLVLWVGTEPKALLTVESVRQSLRRYVAVPREIAAALQRDLEHRTPPPPLQRQVRFLGMRWLGLVSLLWLWPLGSQAATYQVAAGGSLTAAIEPMRGGDTLVIAGGTYPEALVNNLPSGTADAPTTVRAAPGASVTLVAPPGYDGCMIQQEDRQHLVFEGFALDGDWRAPYGLCTGHGSVHQTFRALRIFHHPAQGALLGGRHLTLDQLDIHDNGNDASRQGYRHGIYMAASDSTITHSVIRGHALGYGIQLYPSPSNVTLTCNRFTGNLGNIYVGGRGHVLRQNVVEGATTGIGIDSSDVQIEHNTVFGHSNLGVYWMNGQRGTVRQNAVYDNATNFGPAPGGTVVEGNVQSAAASPAGVSAGCAPAGGGSPPPRRLPAPRNLRIIHVRP